MDVKVTGVDMYNQDLTGDVSATIGTNCGMVTGRNGVLVQMDERLIVLNDQGGARMDITNEVVATLRATANHPPVICLEGNGASPSHRGGGYSEDGRMFTLNTIERHSVCFSIGAMNSEGMLSDNPFAGYHETTVARTIDANGSNPAGYQGGDVVIQQNKDFPVESFGHDERSTQFSRGGAVTH